LKTADTIAAVWFGGWSAVTLVAFGWDKWRAARDRERVSETRLVLLGALGGWPGGLVGMGLFRHKTAKRTFKLKYALGLIPFGAQVWAWLHFR
jgi:uncharacterized membrane protein YsdA (DUF1294 family)